MRINAVKEEPKAEEEKDISMSVSALSAAAPFIVEAAHQAALWTRVVELVSVLSPFSPLTAPLTCTFSSLCPYAIAETKMQRTQRMQLPGKAEKHRERERDREGSGRGGRNYRRSEAETLLNPY